MHAFRHAHASLLLDVGANPKVAQEQMRHSDARITGRLRSRDRRRAAGGSEQSGWNSAPKCAQIRGVRWVDSI